MFVDYQDIWPLPEPWEPKPRKQRLTKRGEKVMLSIISFNLVMMFFGPLAGVTVFHAILSMFGN
ncbi:hypothetical protein IFT84_03875 [Rhizobium sp. CFBP 8762]|uniref:hypothetical protein n=1 Tax=Rhizobium sp. CFBP 8762 TaxID=2775279 RepID=UPI001780E73C|nr:hypothetical protein [Rhizobium sp. CFBP 8762]MBD8553653.1 hypothetical protein [Rhizobium sp. CFBP 8762]